MDQTPNLKLPYIMPSQAQKHVTHNEALRFLDAVVHLSVKSRTQTGWKRGQGCFLYRRRMVIRDHRKRLAGLRRRRGQAICLQWHRMAGHRLSAG